MPHSAARALPSFWNTVATGVPAFVYTVLLRPKPLRRIANKVILKALPRTVRYGRVTVVLNPADSVASAALAFRVYERNEAAFFHRVCKPGMTVLDVGAHVGYYTAMAAERVGASGRVVAVEADPENYSYLEKTVETNAFRNVACFQAAAADRAGMRTLYRSSSNRADNRLYQGEPGWSSTDVNAVALDDLLASKNIGAVDLIKVDVQGSEGLVVAGLENTLRVSPSVVLMLEFWPEGLRNAHTDPAGLLSKLAQLGFAMFELTSGGKLRKIGDREKLIERNAGRKYTNLIALKGSRLSSDFFEN